MHVKAKFTTKADHFLAFFEKRKLFFYPNPPYSFEIPKQFKTASSECEKPIKMPRFLFILRDSYLA
jgi:hypothetical protein